MFLKYYSETMDFNYYIKFSVDVRHSDRWADSFVRMPFRERVIMENILFKVN